MTQSANRCPDMGACHHACVWACYRVLCCAPLSGVYPGDQWPQTMVEAARARQARGEQSHG